MNKMTKKELETLIGSEEKLNARLVALKDDIEALESQKNSGSVMVASHNTILGIKMNGKVTHIVHPKYDKNLVMLMMLDKNLAVPRYEPKVAKEWLKEETKFNVVGIEKVLLSEAELRDILLDEKKNELQVINNSLEAFKNVA